MSENDKEGYVNAWERRPVCEHCGHRQTEDEERYVEQMDGLVAFIKKQVERIQTASPEELAFIGFDLGREWVRRSLPDGAPGLVNKLEAVAEKELVAARDAFRARIQVLTHDDSPTQVKELLVALRYLRRYPTSHDTHIYAQRVLDRLDPNHRTLLEPAAYHSEKEPLDSIVW